MIESLEHLRDLPPALCLHERHWHQGIVGLLASRVKDAIHRPVIVFAPESEGSDLLKGSARSIKGLHIRDVLALVDANNPGLMQAFGGHAMAAGLTLHRSSLETFDRQFRDAVSVALDGASPAAEWLTDGELKPEELDMNLALQIEAFGPWGQRFPEPLFDGRFEVVERRVVGEAHLRMTVRPLGGRQLLGAIAFNHMPEDLPGAASVRLLYRLDVNRWRGNETCQLMVEKIVGEATE